MRPSRRGASCAATRARATTARSPSTPQRLEPTVTWGTTPAQSVSVSGHVPDPESFADAAERESAVRALAYMGLEPGTRIADIALDTVFIGSCTNGRIEDLRAAAAVLDGRRVHEGLRVLVVPGSAQVKAQAETEGLDEIFRSAGAEWRNPGCSMCLGMNPDILQPGERCASTSNRNFEGRQGRGGRTHLVSPGDGRRSRRRRALRRCQRAGDAGGSAVMKPFRREEGVLIPLDRSDVDTDQIIPKQFLKRIERSGYGDLPVQRLAARRIRLAAPRLRAEPARVRRRNGARHRPQLRLRLVARACGLGARRPRHPRGHLRVVRRHLQHQRARQRARARAAAGTRGALPHRPRDGAAGHHRRRGPRDRDGDLRRPVATGSISIRSCAAACSRDSTTSR